MEVVHQPDQSRSRRVVSDETRAALPCGAVDVAPQRDPRDLRCLPEDRELLLHDLLLLRVVDLNEDRIVQILRALNVLYLIKTFEKKNLKE